MKKIWHRWVLIAEKIGDFQIGVFFSILYFILVVPTGFFASLFYDLLNFKKANWFKMENNTSSLDDIKKQ